MYLRWLWLQFFSVWTNYMCFYSLWGTTKVQIKKKTILYLINVQAVNVLLEFILYKKWISSWNLKHLNMYMAKEINLRVRAMLWGFISLCLYHHSMNKHYAYCIFFMFLTQVSNNVFNLKNHAQNRHVFIPCCLHPSPFHPSLPLTIPTSPSVWAGAKC